jgi:ribose-phosphate pyrophosphokinase
MNKGPIILGGSASPHLAAALAEQVGAPVGRAEVERFPDGEVVVRLLESVRQREVFVVQATGPPVDPNLVELLCWGDACRRSSAARVTAVVPYYGYARSDKRRGKREPIAASLVARLIEAAGFDQLITVDLHADQIEGFFQIPVDSLTAMPLLAEAARELLPAGAVVVSPDVGRVRSATGYARLLGLPVVVLHKQRETGTEVHVTKVVGEVRGRACLIIDDMISTGGTIAEGVKALLEAGANEEIYVAATHGPLLEGARERLAHASIRRVLVTDTIAPRLVDWGKQRVVPVARLLAGAVRAAVGGGG